MVSKGGVPKGRIIPVYLTVVMYMDGIKKMVSII